MSRKMEASIKGRLHEDENSGSATFAVNAGELKLRATVTGASLVDGPSLDGLSLAVEKPGVFAIDYDVPKKDTRFQFMQKVKIAEKPLSLNYLHSTGDNRTILEGSLALDLCNKISANYVLGTSNCKLKYTMVHGGIGTFEPCYDVGKNEWDFAVSRRLDDENLLKATYQTSSKVIGLERSRSSKMSGAWKVLASVNLEDEDKMPKLTAESSWNFEITGDNRTILEGSLALDLCNKISANYVLGTSNCNLKYTMVHSGIGTFEPCYDVGKNEWDFAVSRRLDDDNLLKATYQTSSKVISLEWSRSSKMSGAWKVLASVNLEDEDKMPKLTAESSWNFEM